VKVGLLMFCGLAFQMLSAQGVNPPDPKLTLAERYGLLKTKSQSYGEYKAVKESDLDGFWKTTRDSLQAGKRLLEKSKRTIAGLNGQIDSLRSAIQLKEESVQEIRHDSTHISILGISFSKVLFKLIVLILVGTLTMGLVTVAGRMKFMQRAWRTKTEEFEELTKEYADYKHKAMEKQTKLARDLQTELNKSGR
jgi:hypothetical protein